MISILLLSYSMCKIRKRRTAFIYFLACSPSWYKKFGPFPTGRQLFLHAVFLLSNQNPPFAIYYLGLLVALHHYPWIIPPLKEPVRYSVVGHSANEHYRKPAFTNIRRRCVTFKFYFAGLMLTLKRTFIV